MLLCGRPVSAKGALFWAATPFNSSFDSASPGYDYIASFDMTTEVFNITPHRRIYKCSDLFISKWDVAIANYASSTHLEIWLFKGEKLDCVKEFTISLTIPIECFYDPWVIGMWEYDEILIRVRSNDLTDKKKSELYYSYDTTTKQLRSIQVPFEDNTKYDTTVICFRGSMLPLSINGNTHGRFHAN